MVQNISTTDAQNSTVSSNFVMVVSNTISTFGMPQIRQTSFATNNTGYDINIITALGLDGYLCVTRYMSELQFPYRVINNVCLLGDSLDGASTNTNIIQTLALIKALSTECDFDNPPGKLDLIKLYAL